MKSKDYTTTFTVDQSPEEAFEAIKNVRGWWSEEIEGRTDKVGDEFTYHYKDVHTCRMKLVELVPNQRVVWLVCSNAWGSYIKGSLPSLISTGKGRPNQKE